VKADYPLSKVQIEAPRFQANVRPEDKFGKHNQLVLRNKQGELGIACQHLCLLMDSHLTEELQPVPRSSKSGVNDRVPESGEVTDPSGTIEFLQGTK